MNALHGQAGMSVNDGLNNTNTDKIYATGGLGYNELKIGEWTKIEVDVSEVTGTHVVSFSGGYVDQSGNANSSTSICDIVFWHE